MNTTQISIRELTAEQLRTAASFKSEIERLEAKIANLGNGGTIRRRKIAPKSTDGTTESGRISLKTKILEILKEGPLDSQEIVDALQKSGHTFHTKLPRNSVQVVLYTNKDLFKNEGGKFSAV